jgi:hypothetical protein
MAAISLSIPGKADKGQVIYPTGKMSRVWKNCPARFRKINRFAAGLNQIYLHCVPSPSRGVRVVTNVGHGMRWTLPASAQHHRRAGWSRERRAARRTRMAVADGKIVWSWRPDAGAKSCKDARSPTGR